MAANVDEVRQRRDATIVRLRRQGWSLRRIGADPRVRMTHVGVQKVLDRMERMEDDPADGQVDVLLLYRAAYYEKDPAAIRGWGRYTKRAAELMTGWALQRHGCSLEDLDWTARQQLRTEANEKALAEL